MQKSDITDKERMDFLEKYCSSLNTLYISLSEGETLRSTCDRYIISGKEIEKEEE